MGTARIKRGLPKLSWPIFQERIIPQAGNFNLANIKNIKITVKLDQITEGQNFHRRRYQSLPICNLYKWRVFASLDDFASQQYPSLGHFSARSVLPIYVVQLQSRSSLIYHIFLHISSYPHPWQVAKNRTSNKKYFVPFRVDKNLTSMAALHCYCLLKAPACDMAMQEKFQDSR